MEVAIEVTMEAADHRRPRWLRILNRSPNRNPRRNPRRSGPGAGTKAGLGMSMAVGIVAEAITGSLIPGDSDR